MTRAEFLSVVARLADLIGATAREAITDETPIASVLRDWIRGQMRQCPYGIYSLRDRSGAVVGAVRGYEGDAAGRFLPRVQFLTTMPRPAGIPTHLAHWAGIRITIHVSGDTAELSDSLLVENHFWNRPHG